ncbi:MAG: hypothetical protein GC201_09665 [Alphaproteobacteria bacterium]|nr:hypothetical protein [Alphaproteobacteria bacterium]
MTRGWVEGLPDRPEPPLTTVTPDLFRGPCRCAKNGAGTARPAEPGFPLFFLAKNLAFSTPDGDRFEILLRGITRLNYLSLRPNGMVLVIYSRGPALHAVEVDPQTLRIVGPDSEVAVQKS